MIYNKSVMRNRTTAALGILLPPLFIFSSVFLASQDDKAGRATLQHEVTVSLKLIQVFVTDKKGNPVRDLTKDDFVVTDSGREVTITDFEARVLTESEPKSGPPAEEVVSAPAPAPAPDGPALSRKYFLFFDFAFNNQRGVQRSIEAALHFMEKEVRPGDEVALLSYSMIKGLRFHEYLTGDRAKVKEAINAFTSKAIAGRASEIEDAFWRDAQDTTTTTQYSWQRQEAKTIAQVYIQKLTALARALRSVEGQKNFVFFSSGVPASMIYGSQSGNPTQLRDPSKFDVGDPVLRPLNEELYKELSASNCSFFSFDTRDSAKVAALFDYDIATFERGGRGSNRVFTTDGVFQEVTGVFRDDKTTGLDSLKRLSDVTGGKFFSSIRRYEKNLAQVETLTGSYYVLGYYVNQVWDGAFHEVKVDCVRKGCEVRAQAGYYNPKPFREYSDLEKRLQLFDLAINERSLFQTPKTLFLAVLAVPDGSEGRVRMMARVPADALAGIGGKEVEVVSLVFDETAGLADLQRTVSDWTRFQGRDITLLSSARLKPGRYSCRVVVRNLENGASAVGSAPAALDGSPADGFGLQAPLLLAAGASSVSLEAEARDGGAQDLWRSLYPYDHARYAPVLGGLPCGVPALYLIAPCRVPGPDAPPVAVSAFLIHAETGERATVPFRLVFRERKENHEILFLEFPAEGLMPGRYWLYLHAGDAAAPSRSHVRAEFEILS